jgi:hypothetical protein
MPADMALQVELESLADKLEGLVFALLGHTVDDEPLHGQRLAMLWESLENLS